MDAELIGKMGPATADRLLTAAYAGGVDNVARQRGHPPQGSQMALCDSCWQGMGAGQ